MLLVFPFIRIVFFLGLFFDKTESDWGGGAAGLIYLIAKKKGFSSSFLPLENMRFRIFEGPKIYISRNPYTHKNPSQTLSRYFLNEGRRERGGNEIPIFFFSLSLLAFSLPFQLTELDLQNEVERE